MDAPVPPSGPGRRTRASAVSGPLAAARTRSRTDREVVSKEIWFWIRICRTRAMSSSVNVR